MLQTRESPALIERRYSARMTDCYEITKLAFFYTRRGVGAVWIAAFSAADTAAHPGHSGKIRYADERVRLRQARRDDPDARRREAPYSHRRARGRAPGANFAHADAVERI